MSSLTPVSEALTAMANWMMAFAACAGALVAFSGLYSWKKQGKWQKKYEILKEALLGVRMRHEAFQMLRSPLFFAGEYEAENLNNTKEKLGVWSEQVVIEKRAQNLREAREKLFPTRIEASVIWGREIEGYFEEIDKIEVRVFAAFRSLNVGTRMPARATEAEVAFRRIAYSSSDDPIGSDYAEKIRHLESFLTKKLEKLLK
ncbi:hypothetical protein OS190_02635 [Sulfitobacter sp. F26204]|uniref:hypothetical protein n=1 Tax=Sulfitobacter sp. F26204 TaxID=2996014 RepID=UPI00225E16FD|nr:hypothetical protein [Sulfitobacter sp. F26204]MCX7558447.1 hypothetical protein [Sulfitobacter sp. F26204]